MVIKTNRADYHKIDNFALPVVVVILTIVVVTLLVVVGLSALKCFDNIHVFLVHVSGIATVRCGRSFDDLFIIYLPDRAHRTSGRVARALAQ